LTFAVAQPPDASTRACARSGSTAGIVTLTGTLRRRGGGQGVVAASSAAASQAADSAAP